MERGQEVLIRVRKETRKSWYAVVDRIYIAQNAT